ncbi:MAG: ABC transporter substrate-binding protein [Leptolyngbyaceae cyanobacterium MO_188.B28]|nr:ABC transporter substrate-binding protein [Leptolyngbyaceae cyanobacterium MO_188.B28]
MVSNQLGFKRLYRRQFNTLLGLASLGLALTFSGCSSKTVETAPTSGTVSMPNEIRVGYQIIPNAELLAKSQGLVEENLPGVKISWIQYSSGGDVNKAMADGEIDLGLAGSVPVSTGVATELPYQVYFIHDIIGDNEALAVKTDSGIVRFEDLKGKKIAVPFGSTTHFSLLSSLKQNGIEPGQLEIIDMAPDQILSAWQKGEIDGSFVWHPTLGKMLEDNGIVLVSAKQLADEGIITADLAVVHQNFASQYPEAMSKYVEALDKAVTLYRSDPKAASEAISSELGLTPEQSLMAMDELVWLSAEDQASAKYLGTPNQVGALAKVLRESAEFMVTQGAIEQAPDLETYNKAIYSAAVNSASK